MTEINRCVDHEFAVWAFGEAWVDYLVGGTGRIDLMEAWNERHGDKLLLDPSNIVVDDMKRMKLIWRAHETSDAKHGPKVDDVEQKYKHVSPCVSGCGERAKKYQKQIVRTGEKNGQENAQGDPEDEASREGYQKRKTKASVKSIKGRGKKE